MGFGASQLPTDLWVECLSFLSHADLGRALCTCRALAAVSNESWRAACYRRWPKWALIAEEAQAEWRRVYEFCSLRRAENAALPDLQAILKRQTVVRDRHRAILAEWMCEVSFDWNLESSVVFHAIRYLDHFLQAHPVAELGRFQLVGLACLRIAMRDAPRPTPRLHNDPALDPIRFAYVSDDTYTAAQVEECTQVVDGVIRDEVKEPPNAKMFLRSFWQHAIANNVVHSDDMHLYTLAAFILQLGLLHLPAAAFPASQQAAAALSLAFTTFSLPAWPKAMQSFGSYAMPELEACRGVLAQAQASRDAEQLRRIWVRNYQDHGYENFAEEWRKLLSMLSCTSANLLDAVGIMPVATSSTTSGSSGLSKSQMDASVQSQEAVRRRTSDGASEQQSSERAVAEIAAASLHQPLALMVA